MAKVNRKSISASTLISDGSGLTKCFLSVVPNLESSWRGWVGQLPWLAAQGLWEVVEAH
jgi:hypothetical protein